MDRRTTPSLPISCAAVPAPISRWRSSAHAPWNAGVALVAENFGDRRVLLAGDAVHLFTPTGGFGMNTGVDDAANLAWKLAAMVQGWGGANLLASYETERMPIALRNTEAARKLAANINATDIGAAIEAADAGGRRGTARRERDAVDIQRAVRLDRRAARRAL